MRKRVSYLSRVYKFLIRLKSIAISKRCKYIKGISREELNYICEIILNFLHSKIKVGFITLKKLKKFRSLMHKLVAKNISANKKKSILCSLKGLYIYFIC